MRSLLISILITASFVSFSQKVKLGEFDEKYFTMTHCPFDSSAGAFVIKDYGVSRLDHNYEIEFKRHRIIKILSSEEYDLANVKIRYSKRDRIGDFKAVSYNYENGQVVETELKRRDAVIEKVNDDIQSFNFTFPDVKEGTIIEYSYSANYGDVTRLNTWYFQSSIPIIQSKYEVWVPSFFEYERMFQSYFPLKTATVRTENRPLGSGFTTPFQLHNYVAVNVPAFKDEPYITTTDDYISKIDFELKRYTIPGSGTKTYLPSNFASYASGLYEAEAWGKSIQDVKFVDDIVSVLKSSSSSDEELAKAIYYYVRDNFEEDYDEDYPTLKKAFNEKKGASWQINRILGAMLNQAGFESYLVRISTRRNGRVNKFIPIARQFNHTIVKTTVGETDYVLDASDKNTPFEALPKYCLNGEGLVIKPTLEWVPLEPFSSNGVIYNAEMELTEDGILIGNLTIRRNGYEAWEFKETIEEDGEDEYKEGFNENRETWIIDEHTIGELSEDHHMDESLVVEIEDKMDDLGDIAYLNPIILGQRLDNPFKKEERSFPVNYGAPFTITHIYKIKVDEAFIIEETPGPKSVALPNGGGRLLFSTSVNGNEINVMNRIQITKSEFPAEEYPYLREFYAQLVEKHGQQIVLKRK